MSVFRYKSLELSISNPLMDRGFEYLQSHNQVGSYINLEEMLLDNLTKLRCDFAWHLKQKKIDSDFKTLSKKVTMSYNFFCWMIKFREKKSIAIKKRQEYFDIRTELFKQYYLLKNNVKKVKGETVLVSDGINRFVQYYDLKEGYELYTSRTDLKNTKINVVKQVKIDNYKSNYEILHPYYLHYIKLFLEFNQPLRHGVNRENLKIINPEFIIKLILDPDSYYNRIRSTKSNFYGAYLYSEWIEFFNYSFIEFEISIKNKGSLSILNNCLRKISSRPILAKINCMNRVI